MGYYENPPIVQPSRGSDIVSASIANAASALSQGLIARGERKHQEEKEHRLTVQKLQERKNEVDLYYNDKLTDWASKQSHVNEDVDNQIHQLVQDKITLAADSRIKLLNETNPANRQILLNNISKANAFLDNSAAFAKSIAGQTATWRLDTKAVKVGEAGGHVVSGDSDTAILNNTAAVEVLGGMNALYKDPKIKVDYDSSGEGIVLNVSGYHTKGSADGKDLKDQPFNVSINSQQFIKSEAEGDTGLLQPVESLDTFHTKARETIVDKKGEIYDGYLMPNYETVDLPSTGNSGHGVGKDVWQMTAKRLNMPWIKNKIKETSDVTTSGILSADSPSRLRTMLDYTLKQGIGYYDKHFKVDDKGVARSPEEQKQMLSEILTNKAVENMTKSLKTTKDTNGNTIYWQPTDDIKLKDKLSEAEIRANQKALDGNNEPKNTTYRSENYDNIIKGYTPAQGEKLQPGQVNYRTVMGLVDNLNKLSGSNGKYEHRSEVFERYKKSKLAEDEDLTEDDLKKGFNKVIPPGDILVKVGDKYRPIKGYDLKKAEQRIKLALDQTSNASERKILQSKIGEARLMDWVHDNPMKQNETQEQYAARARKSNK
jgi:hypothetical protein